MNSLFKRTVGHHRRRPARSSYVCKIPNTEILLFPDCPRICRQSQISLIVWDGRRQIWRIGNVCIFPTRPRFLQWPVIIPTNENTNLYRRGRRRFAHYQPSKLLGSSLPIIHLCTNFNFWRTFHFPPNSILGESGADLWRLSDISTKSGTVSKK